MKAKSNWVLCSAVALVMFVRSSASGFYDPGLQRWINRDPLGDIASLPLMSASAASSVEFGDGEMSNKEFFDAWIDINRNVYGVMRNNLVGVTDSFGLSPSLNPANQAAAAECLETAAQAGARNLALEAERLAEAARKAKQAADAAKKAADAAKRAKEIERVRKAENRIDKAKDIQKAQSKDPAKINRINKSEQNLKKELRDIANDPSCAP